MNNDFKDEKVLILGLGLNQGGVGAAKYFAKQGAEVRVTDLKNEEILKPSLEQLKEFENISYTLGEHKEEDIDWADLIIRNWGVKRDSKYLVYAKEKGKEIETDIGVFISQVSPKQIIGITGSKGKTTTASLIYYALKIQNPDVSSNSTSDVGIVLVGNIGNSVLDSLEKINSETMVILEVSSFQLEAFEEKKISPHFAVITNIFPEHLNYYQSFEDYKNSKKIIGKYQTEKDFLFLNQDDQILTSDEFLKDLKVKIVYFSPKDLPEDFNPTLKGDHNKASYAAALTVVKELSVDETSALDRMNKFQGAEFRLQIVKEINGIKIINDSSATNPNATIEALKTYPNSILICGGMNKGLDYEDLARAIEENTKAVYLLEGNATEDLKSLIINLKPKGEFNNLEELLKAVKTETNPGDIILFSPGATSFNLFQNEFDRGRKFTRAVEEVFQ